MKYDCLVLLICLLTTFPAIAQKDIKAKEMLEKSEIAFNSSGAISAYFTINIRESVSRDIKSFDGTIYIKGNKFKINAPDYDVYFDGTTQWVYNKIHGEVNISDPDTTEIQTLNPSVIYQIYRKGCNYKFVGTKTDVKMRKVSEIILMPKSKKQDVRELTLQVNEKDFLPVYFHLKFKNNDLDNEIFINKYNINQNLSDNIFIFDASQFPDVEIIDLR
ncbi:MAG: hypothetical protein LBJ17_09285 [Dysgonamonadaceae bacterium]|jgi:hypothetical protein|nr:hypothetical protein [Dysgonamonadaceae bacterium]